MLDGELPRPSFPARLRRTAPQLWYRLASGALAVGGVHASRGDRIAALANFTQAVRRRPRAGWPLTGGGYWDLMIMDGPGPVCLVCANLDHLVFLPAGDAALTRRAKRASSLSAAVVRYSRSRRRYERQEALVEEAALAGAEAECLADEEARRRRQSREETRRKAQDLALQAANR